MSKFERIEPGKRCANFLSAVEKERRRCSRLARRTETTLKFSASDQGATRPIKPSLDNSWGGSMSCKTTNS